MSEVNVFKLASSEEIICTVIAEETDHFRIEKVRAVGPQQHEGGALSLQWMPFIWSDVEGNAKETLYKSCIIGRIEESELQDNMKKEYITKTSGIVIAGAGDIT